jgi:hypothetical protein
MIFNNEINDNLQIFRENLLALFSKENRIFAESINLRLFELALENTNLFYELEKILYINEEKLSNKEFTLDEKPKSPAVANWLKDFIKKNGSGMFDNLVLTQYLTASENAKKLDPAERDLLKKLLLTYRHLKFFPASMPNDYGDGWEIIPIEIEAAENKTDNDKTKSDLQNLAASYPIGSLERKAIEEEIKKIENKQ